MRNATLFLSVLMLATAQIVLADTGSGESASGYLTSMPPAAPTLNSPADGTTNLMSSDLTWGSLSHAASYNLQVSTESDFTPAIADESGLTGTTFNVSGLSGNVQYYWHVSATNVAGTGDFSETWDFTTDASLPVEQTLFSVEPVAGGVLIRWITESETDNLGFILERAFNGLNSPEWQVIASYQTHASLSGQGNTSSRTDYAFTDGSVQPGETYQYRLSDVDTQGERHIYEFIQIALPDASEITTLEPPFPNPFNPGTKLSYRLSDAGHVEVSVYNLMGRKIQTLLNAYQPAGSYNLYWHGKDDSGTQMASGSYLIMLKTAEEIQKKKVVLLH
jgi:hypothetical protein